MWLCNRISLLDLLVSPTAVAEYTAQLGERTTLSTFKVGGYCLSVPFISRLLPDDLNPHQRWKQTVVVDSLVPSSRTDHIRHGQDG